MGNIQNSDNMFYNCTSLTGGNGTTFDANHTDAEYARIDKPGQPGYFTQKYMNHDTTPFQQKYWVIFTEGYRNDRVEASTFDSNIPAEQLTIIWDSALEISDSSGSDGCDQYYLDNNGEWIYMGNYHRLTDKATNVLASNLNVVDRNGNVVVSRIPYSMIDWNKINRYR